MGGIINIVIGLVLIVAGLSGGLVLRGANSGVLLAVVGGVIVVFDVFRLMRANPSS